MLVDEGMSLCTRMSRVLFLLIPFGEYMWPLPVILQFTLLGDLLYDLVTVLLIVFGDTSDYDVVTPPPFSV
jgi:hypothetical protein